MLTHIRNSVPQKLLLLLRRSLTKSINVLSSQLLQDLLEISFQGECSRCCPPSRRLTHWSPNCHSLSIYSLQLSRPEADPSTWHRTDDRRRDAEWWALVMVSGGRFFQPPWLVGWLVSPSHTVRFRNQRGGTRLICLICSWLRSFAQTEFTIFKTIYIYNIDVVCRSATKIKLGSGLVFILKVGSQRVITEVELSSYNIVFKVQTSVCLTLWLVLHGEFRVILTSSGYFTEHKGTTPCCLQVLAERQ